MATLKFFKKVPRIPVKGKLGEQLIETTVDSELARYYLEHYLQHCRCDPRLDDIIDQASIDNGNPVPSAEDLKYLTQKFSPDFATIYLAKRLLEDRASLSIYQTFNRELANVRDAKANGYQLHPASRSYCFLFVPGWVYKSKPESGADLARPREIVTQHGLENYLIEINETGTIEENAVYIAEELLRFSRLSEKIILVSASTGGPSVHLALGKLLERSQLRNVKAWVNIGGLLRGSFHADASTRWPRRWFAKTILFLNGWNYESVVSVTTEKSRERFRQINVPSEIFCVNYIGIPLSGNITERGRDGYFDSRAEGPNDGMTLITDALMPNGVTIPMLGVDHYLDQEMDFKTIAVTQTVVKQLEST